MKNNNATKRNTAQQRKGEKMTTDKILKCKNCGKKTIIGKYGYQNLVNEKWNLNNYVCKKCMGRGVEGFAINK